MAETTSNSVIFQKTAHKTSFSEPWKSSNLVLVVEGRRFHVHREVLIVCSPVFEAMLSSNFKEKSAFEIALPDKKADEIQQLLETIYPDRKSPITKENWSFLLAFANEYQIDILKERCENALSTWCNRDMNAGEAITVVVFSQKYPLDDKIVQICMEKFVSQADRRWDVIKKEKLYSELEPANEKRILEERVKFLESKSAMFLCDDLLSGYCDVDLHRKPKRTRRLSKFVETL